MNSGSSSNALESYSDESYDHTKRVYIIAGWIASPQEWEILIPKWEDILGNYKITTFHTTDCCQGIKAFDNWPSSKKASIMKDLIDLLERSDILGMAAGVLVKDFEKVLSNEADRELFGGEPYFLAFQEYVGFLTEFVANQYSEHVVNFTFDEHSEFRPKAKEIYESISRDARLAGTGHYGTLAFKHDDVVIPLQAADLLAYETQLALQRKYYPSDRPERMSFARLKGIKKLLKISYYDAKTIKIILDLKKEEIKNGGMARE
jgi:hypothetical protein